MSFGSEWVHRGFCEETGEERSLPHGAPPGCRVPSRTVASCLLVLSFFGAPAIRAHPTVESRLTALDRAIVLAPDDPELYRRRGALWADLGDFAAARYDFRKARDLGWSPPAADAALAELELRDGRFAEALAACDRALAGGAERVSTLRVRARALTGLGHDSAAAIDFDRALDLTPRATPALWVEWARAMAAAGAADRAVRGLERAISELGPLTSLERTAFDLERSTGAVREALARAGRLVRTSPRPELWAVIRADLLADSGRDEEARTAYAEALEVVRTRSDRRMTRSLAELERRARAGSVADADESRSVEDPDVE